MKNLLFIPIHFSLGFVNIAIVDIIALVLVTIFAIIGIKKGFMQQVLSLFGKVAALIFAIFFCSSFASLVCDIAPIVPETVEGWVEGVFGEGLNDTFNSKEHIMSVLQTSSIPVFLHEVLANAVVESNFTLSLIPIISKFVLNIISFVVLYFLSRLLVVLLKKIFKETTKLPILNQVDKFLGLLFALLKMIVLCVIVVIILSFFLPINNYLKPDGAFCVFNAVLEFVMQLDFAQKLIMMIA